MQRKMYGEKPPGETGHRANILSTQFTKVGISVVFDAAHLRMWVTQDFGRP